VTFTNKAAREMRERVAHLIGPVAEGMQWLGTFHSIGTKILRRHAELVGLRSDFTILGTDDQLRLLKQVIEAEGIDEKRWPARQLAGSSTAGRTAASPRAGAAGEAQAFANGKGGRLYAAYQERLKTLNASISATSCSNACACGASTRTCWSSTSDRFRYMLVDEYQDTNVAQYLWLRLLAQAPQEPVLRRRRRPVDLRLARRGGRQHPALRARLSGRRRDPAGAQLPLHRPHPRRRLRASSPTTRAASARPAHRGHRRARRSPSPAPGIPRTRPA
jgi:superfamily I DNA/RNA helicase